METQASRRSSRAGFWVRAAAAAVDAVIGVGVTLLLSSSVGMYFARRAVVTLHIGEPGTWWTGPLPFMLGVAGEVVYLLPFVFFWTWMLDPLTSATLGKRLFGLRVRDSGGRAASAARRWCRSAILTAGLWGWTVALVSGTWQIAAAATVAGAVALAGTLAALGPASLALHDRLCGTGVFRANEIAPAT